MKKEGTEVEVDFLPRCDFGTHAHAAVYDAKTEKGPWAYMCQTHFERFGIGLGLGKGQRLVKRKEG